MQARLQRDTSSARLARGANRLGRCGTSAEGERWVSVREPLFPTDPFTSHNKRGSIYFNTLVFTILSTYSSPIRLIALAAAC